MNKSLLMIVLSTVLAGSALAQTAAPSAAPAKATPATTASAPAPAATPAKPAKPAAAAKTVAPGGGPDKVWANTASKVYHCYGSKDYGTTKQGEYLTEADAKAKGFHSKKGCSK